MRMFHWPAAFAPFVEDTLETIDLAIRTKNVHAMRKHDPARLGGMTIAVVPHTMIEQGVEASERNAKIVALVRAPGFQMFPARGGTIVMTAGAHSVTCKSVDACFDALLAVQDGSITESDLDGREDGSQVVAMGAR